MRADKTILAFAVAPLWVTGATVVFGIYGFPYSMRYMIIVTAIVGTLFAYAGTLIFGVPAYRALTARQQTAPWIALVLGAGVAGVTWAIILFLFWLDGTRPSPVWWLSFFPVFGLGSVVGLTIWLIARPDRLNSGTQEVRSADINS
jgi:hypothetical protein